MKNKIKRLYLSVWMLIVMASMMAMARPAVALKDSESATHGMGASSYSIVDIYPYSGFKVVQFELPVLSIYSYMLISDGEALVIDPVRDIDIYLETAKTEDVIIKGVYLTHSHADFIAGHMEMVRAVQCPIYQSQKSGVRYKIEPLSEGSTIHVGKAVIKFLDTPGHTPDGMCALVYGAATPEVPELMFTGDVIFVGSVGRPDLMGGTISAAWLASAVFDSWHNKIAKLPDSVRIFPAHGAGSLCGAHLSDEPYSTIGQEKASNPYLQYKSRSEFIAALLEGLPDSPQYFKHNARMNREGPPLVNWEAPLPKETTTGKDLTDPSQYYVIDLRDAKAHAAGHIPNAINIALRGRLETWVGIMVPWKAKLVLCGSRDELKEAVFRLHRIGYGADVVTMTTWEKNGLPLVVSHPISPRELYQLMQKGEAPVIVDVRLPSEWMALRIGTVLNLPLNQLAELSTRLDPQETVVTVCNSAYRSSMAVGVLERKGFKHVRNLEGGSEAWTNVGLPVIEASPKGRGAQLATRKQVQLPERISASELKRLLMDLPGTFDLVDIRPPEYFQDYHIPGSVNVDVAEIITDAAWLVGVGPLVVVDRDGSLAMAVGGILSQKTKRPIKVLYGGLEQYWAENHTPTKIMRPDLKPPASTLPPSDTRPSDVPAAPVSPPSKAKRKSAGC